MNAIEVVGLERVGVLAGIGVPRIRSMKERSYQATLRSDLGALRTAQEAYYAENLRYATDVSALAPGRTAGG